MVDTNGRAKKWRRTAVESFGCPLRYQRLQNEGMDDTGDEAVRGRAFHAAAAVYVLRLAAKQLIADHEEARAAFTDGLSIASPPDHLIAEVERLFFRWAESFELDLDAFLSAEVLEESESREFRPDVVYCRPHELELVDLKTFYKGLTEAQARDELQLRWYLVEAVKKWPGFEQYRFTYEFVRLGAKARISLVFTPDQIAAFEPSIDAKIAAIERADQTGEYPPLPGSHCRFCRLSCPVVDEPKRQPIRFMTRAQAEEGAAAYLPLTQRRKILRKALDGWCAKEGPLTVNGETFEHTQGETRSYRLDDVLEHLRPDQRRAIMISESTLLDVFRKRDQIPPTLAEKARREPTWRFNHHKVGAKDDTNGETS